jgi:dATP pyrophosphohydrolase
VYKIPISILVVIYNQNNQILLLQRYDNNSFWQSVTGSLDSLNEPLHLAAQREVCEETGIIINNHINTNLDKFNPNDAEINTLYNLDHSTSYNIYQQFRHKYPPFTSTNQEHWFALKIQNNQNIKLSQYEHISYKFVSIDEAMQTCFSPSNAIAIQKFLSLSC